MKTKSIPKFKGINNKKDNDINTIIAEIPKYIFFLLITLKSNFIIFPPSRTVFHFLY